jgi:SAM-dependent methyltransferase
MVIRHWDLHNHCSSCFLVSVASRLEDPNEGQTALDLGCGSGSAAYAGARCRVVAVDVRRPTTLPRPARGGFVQADAARLPLPDSSCDLALASHSLEHISDWRGALCEAARVLRPEGALVVAVPDGHSLSDALYRFLDKGREHVNRFRREEFVEAVERQTGLRLAAWRLLYSSYSFLNRQPGQRFGGRARPLNWMPAPLLGSFLLAWNAIARAADRRLGARWSVYGWQFEFRREAADGAVEEPPEPNVCIQCGSSHSGAWLKAQGAVGGRLLRRYRCPDCKALNLFFD